MKIPNPILVTGATGFIGRHLVERLLREGNQVRVLVLPHDPISPPWLDRVELVRGDVADSNSVEQALDGIRTVFHLVAKIGDWGEHDQHYRVTVGGTENVLSEAAARGIRAVLVSSIVVYGNAIRTDTCDEDHPHAKPMGPYSKHKQIQEKLALRLARDKNLELVVVRPANVYGPYCDPWVHGVIDVLHKNMPSLIDRGENNAGLVHVDNVVELMVRAAEAPQATGRIYNACDVSDVTWRRYLTDLARMAGAKPPKSLPYSIAKPAAYLMAGIWWTLRIRSRPLLTHEVLNLIGSNHRIAMGRAVSELDYKPVITYEEALPKLQLYIEESGLRRE